MEKIEKIVKKLLLYIILPSIISLIALGIVALFQLGAGDTVNSQIIALIIGAVVVITFIVSLGFVVIYQKINQIFKKIEEKKS